MIDVNAPIENIISNVSTLARKNWPQPPLLYGGDKTEYQNNMYQQMKEKYIAYLQKNNINLTYKELTSHNLIELKNVMATPTDTKHDLPDISLNDQLVTILRFYKQNAFMPCFNEYTMRVNKKRYIHIIITDKSTHHINMTLTDYIGDKYLIIKGTTVSYEITFENIDKLTQMSWETVDITTYNEIMSQHINDMNWSKEQIKMWYDRLNIPKYTSQTYSYECERLNDTKDDIIDKTYRGTKALLEYKKDLADYLLKLFCKYTALINTALFHDLLKLKSKNPYVYNCVDEYNKIVITAEEPIIRPNNTLPDKIDNALITLFKQSTEKHNNIKKGET